MDASVDGKYSTPAEPNVGGAFCLGALDVFFKWLSSPGRDTTPLGVQQQVSTTDVLNGCPTIGVHSVGGFQVGARMGQGNFIMISFVRGFAPDSAHALPIAGFGQGSLLARNLTWGLARERTLPTFNDRGPLRGESMSVWGLEGPTSTNADLFNDSGAPTKDESLLGRRLVAGGGPLDDSSSAVFASVRRAALNHLINILHGPWAPHGVVIIEVVVVVGFGRRSWNNGSFGDNLLDDMRFGWFAFRAN